MKNGSRRKINLLQVKIGGLCLFLLVIGAGIFYLLFNLLYSFFSSLMALMLTSAAISIIITAILGYFISASTVRRISDLTDSARSMLEGDFGYQVDDQNDDELGQLGKVINSLRRELDQNLEEVSKEKSKLEIILTHLADGVIVVSLDGRFTHANPAAKTMLRISDEDMLYTTYDDIILKYDENLVLENLVANTEDSAATETFMYGGATFSVRYDKFKDENGQIEGIIIIIEDITERNKIENMQVDFIANISHELKTPLTTVKSYTETLLEGGAADRNMTMEFLGIIDSEVDRMNRMVKDLLQLSRLDYKQQKWYKKQEDLVSLVRTAIKKMDMTAKSKELQVNLLFDTDMVILVDIDRDRIEQVILNVLSNAIKYTDEKGRIDIDIIKKPKEVQVIIADNGMGIPEKQLARVFERFFRVDKARSRMMGGTGLGLSISRQIMEEHKGSITAESKLGQGTTVFISIPLAPIRGKRNIE